jgi:ankyrin repeat protein
MTGGTPLAIVSQEGHKEVVELLLRAGAEMGKGPLLVACQNGHKDIAQLLLRAGADKNSALKSGATPLFMACLTGHKDVLELLLRAGADHDIAAEDDATPLIVVSQEGYKDVVELLLEAGANVFKARLNSWMPISIAAHEGHTEVCEILCSAAVASTPPDDRGFKLVNLQGCHIRDSGTVALAKRPSRPTGLRWRSTSPPTRSGMKVPGPSPRSSPRTGAGPLQQRHRRQGNLFALPPTLQDVPAYEGESLAFNIAFARAREEEVKPRSRSLSALLADPTDHDLADVVKEGPRGLWRPFRSATELWSPRNPHSQSSSSIFK